MDDLSNIEIAGMTDSGIVVSILNKHNIPATNENISAFLDSYVHFLSLNCRSAGVNCFRACSVARIVEKTSSLRFSRETSHGAPSAGTLWRLAFLSSTLSRTITRIAQLGSFARARAKEKHSREFSAAETDVIGDTPRDIACGRALGARTIAVATGNWSHAQLAKYQPDFLIDDLSNVDSIIDTLGW
jgi:hypothetical protein